MSSIITVVAAVASVIGLYLAFKRKAEEAIDDSKRAVIGAALVALGGGFLIPQFSEQLIIAVFNPVTMVMLQIIVWASYIGLAASLVWFFVLNNTARGRLKRYFDFRRKEA